MKNRFLPLLISLILTGILIFTVKDFMRHVIVEPLLYILWFIMLVLNSLPQAIFWALFIIMALIIASKSLATGKTEPQKGELVSIDNKGSVATWYRLLERADTQAYSKWHLARTLRKFTWDQLSSQERFTLDTLDKQKDPWQQVKSSFPPEIGAYFEAGLASFEPASRGWSRRKRNQHSAALEL